MGCLYFKSGREKLNKETLKSFYDFKMKDIDGNIVDFKTYRDRKVIMIVNVAS
jgi:glutathione peroxidase